MAPACVNPKMRQTTIRGIDDNRKVGTVKSSVNDMFMYTSCVRLNMAKLYWRIKKNGKWTWRPATVIDEHTPYLTVVEHDIDVCIPEEE